ncbi:MAG: hypothetical protein WCL18_02780 [bacterium]
MGNFIKITGITILCSVFFLGFVTKASTGDGIGTGSVLTGSIPYTGDLLTYLNTQKSGVNSLMMTTYDQLYSIFSKT